MARIAHLSDVYWPSVGGLERSIYALSTRQKTEGHDVVVVTPEVRGRPKVDTMGGVEIRRLRQFISRLPIHESTSRPFSPPFRDPTLSRQLVSFFREWQPDIVHAHGLIVYSALDAARAVRAGLVINPHDYSLVCAKKTLLYKQGICTGPAFIKCVRCAVDHYGPKGLAVASGLYLHGNSLRDSGELMAISRAVAQWGYAPGRGGTPDMSIVPTFMDDSVFDLASSAERPVWAPANPYLMFVGALTKEKGISQLLDAFSLVRQRHPEIELLVVTAFADGDGEPLHGDGVTVVRQAPHAEILGAWRSAEIGVHPALWAEPLGQSVIECLAAGTPLVASAAGGIVEILEDESAGILVPPGDVPLTASAISELLDNPHLRAQLGAAGPTIARMYSMSVVWPRVQEVYELALARVGKRWQ